MSVSPRCAARTFAWRSKLGGSSIVVRIKAYNHIEPESSKARLDARLAEDGAHSGSMWMPRDQPAAVASTVCGPTTAMPPDLRPCPLLPPQAGPATARRGGPRASRGSAVGSFRRAAAAAAGPPLIQRLPRLGLPVDPPPAAHDAFDVLGRARAPHLERPCFGLRGGHAGQRLDRLGQRTSTRPRRGIALGISWATARIPRVPVPAGRAELQVGVDLPEFRAYSCGTCTTQFWHPESGGLHAVTIR